MTNDKRERLVELLQEARTEEKRLALFGDIDTQIDMLRGDEFTASHLLENDVIVPPCKAGDTVYTIYDKKVYEAVCEYVTTVQHKEGSFTKIKAEFEIEDSVYYDGRKTRFGVYGMYETDVFLTKEEAENAIGGVQ